MAVLEKIKGVAVWLLLLLAAALTAGVYWPGLNGPFIFDDFGNLDKLGALGGVDNWSTFKAFVFGGGAGPTGRPISLLSFVLNAQNWPVDPFNFKLTNLVIHLLNGMLIFTICKQLLSIDKQADRNLIILVSVTTAGIWLLHPFLVSTTLYVVQRMTQLAALFCFVGISGYLYGRSLLLIRPNKAYLLMSLSVGVGTVLAVYSKENGALLPVLILVMELTIFNVKSDANTNARVSGRWKFLFLQLPSLLIMGYLVWRAIDAGPFRLISSRGFSIYERLLTEGRVLLDYQAKWFLPRLYTAGVFQDAYPKSTGFFQPLSTAWAAIIHLITITLLFAIRKRWSIVSFAGLFFYASHLIESTTVPIELYFEHRNYIGVAFLVLPFVMLVYKYLATSVAITVSLMFWSLLAVMTFNTANIWSNYNSMVLSWAQSAPDSPRAQQQASLQLYNHGNINKSLKIADNAVERLPDVFELRLWQLAVHCRSTTVEPSHVAAALKLAETSKYDLRTTEYYNVLLESVHEGACQNLTLDDVFSIVSSLLKLPSNANPRSAQYAQIQYFLGAIRVYQNKVKLGVEHFNRSISARSSPDRVMHIAAFLAEEAAYSDALVYAERARSILQRGKLGATGRPYQEFLRQIIDFENVVKADIQAELN